MVNSVPFIGCGPYSQPLGGAAGRSFSGGGARGGVGQTQGLGNRRGFVPVEEPDVVNPVRREDAVDGLIPHRSVAY